MTLILIDATINLTRIMLFHFDIETQEKPIGYVADSCVWCRDAESHVLIQKINMLRFMTVSLFALSSKRYVKTCHECGCTSKTEKAKYQSVVPNEPEDIEHLIEFTNPTLMRGVAGEFQAVGMWLDAATNEDVRAMSIAREVLLYFPVIRARRLETHYDKWSIGWLLLMLSTLFSTYFTIEVSETMTKTLFITGFLCLVAALYCITTDVKRFARRGVLSRLAIQLVTLEPKLHELDYVRTLDNKMRIVIDACGKHNILARLEAISNEA